MRRTTLLHVSGVLMLGGLRLAIAADALPEWRHELREPSPEFSQMPFWFWNDALTDDEIRRQMADFREHGVYGFVIHARIGLPKDIAYMGDRWMGHVQTAVEEAARTGMRVCLYDEGMYPSGSAHGAVVRSNPDFAAQGLLMTAIDARGGADVAIPAVNEGEPVAAVAARRTDAKNGLDAESLRVADPSEHTIPLPDGDWRVMVFTRVPTQGRIRGVHEGEDDRQPDAPPAADLLNPEAMQAFLRFAYEPYARALRPHFGKTVIATFTDEPSLQGRAPRRGLKPWTRGFEAYFQAKRGYDLRPLLPALFQDIGPRTASIRQDYERTLAERLDEAYYRPLSVWCERNGIALTGHPAGATEIQPLRYFQIPGQDLVWRGVVPDGPTALNGPNSTLAKCSSSVARHDQRRRNSNELYGAYGWQLTMEEMKWIADWMLVRGVDLLYPHAFYYSTRDGRGNERPPDVGPNNAWWAHYRVFADYTTRLCGLLARNRQVCEVAILCENDRLPWRAARWLYQHQVDFNYLEQWRVVEQARVEGDTLRVGDMAYRCVIVDQDAPPPAPVLARLREAERAGIHVRTCAGEPGPSLIAGITRDVIAQPDTPDLRSLHLAGRGVEYYLLVNEGGNAIETRITVRARGRSEWFDAWTGALREAPAVAEGDEGVTLPLRLERRASIVLCIERGKPPLVLPAAPAADVVAGRVTLEAWTVRRPDGTAVDAGLRDWGNLPGMDQFAGTLRYETTFPVARRDGSRYLLDLGRVGDFASVRANGRDLGVRFWAPWTWDVTDVLRDGDNTLHIEVTNSLANRYDARNRRASGLMGPVVLEERHTR